MVRTWLKQLNKNGFPRQRKGERGAWKPPSARLSVEALEKRELLSGGNTAGYSLSSAGVLFYQPPSGGIFALDTGVRDFCVPGSVVYDLRTDGRVFQIANGNLRQVYANAGALVSDATNNVFTLDLGTHTILEHVQGAYGSWFQVYGNAGALVSDATGNLFALDFGNHTVREHAQGTTSNWFQVGSNILSLVSDTRGNVFELSFEDHNVYEHTYFALLSSPTTGVWTWSSVDTNIAK